MTQLLRLIYILELALLTLGVVLLPAIGVIRNQKVNWWMWLLFWIFCAAVWFKVIRDATR